MQEKLDTGLSYGFKGKFKPIIQYFSPSCEVQSQPKFDIFVGKTFGPSSSLSTCIFPEYSVGVTISMLECKDGEKESAPVKGMRHKCILV